MAGTGRPPPKGGGSPSTTNSTTSPTSALPATSAWAGGRSSEVKKMRNFEEIIADATANRNILEINLKKNISTEEPNRKQANLTYDQLGELIFDILKISEEDCIRLNFTTSRYDTREVLLKPDIDINPFITTISDFYGHSVTTRKQSSNIIRVSFRNVPINMPDEEIIHLCNSYRKPIDNNVQYDKMSNAKCQGFQGSTRFVGMEMSPGKVFNNYYWMEGPLPGDQGCRITVLHSGQERQCGHCLKTGIEGCPGQGQGKVCKELGTKMTRMVDYMSSIKSKTGYESLKATYIRRFPSLGDKNPQGLNMSEQEDEEEKGVSEPTSQDTLDKKNAEIEALTKLVKEKEDLAKEVVKKAEDKKNAEIEALTKLVKEKEDLAEEVGKNVEEAEQCHFQTKRSGDLSRNKDGEEGKKEQPVKYSSSPHQLN